MAMGRHLVVLVALSLLACTRERDPSTNTGAQAASGPSNVAQVNAAPASASDGARAEIGKTAPDFALKDLDGKEVRLSSFKGKTVVLEWFNPGCPFVKKAHTAGSLKDAAKRHTAKGVVWLGVNSAAAGKQGFGAEANREAAKTFSMEHPILLDESGDVGKKYGATNTPHMMVIDPAGTLVYRGAIDNSPDGEGQSPTDGKLVSYVDAALTDLAGGRAVGAAETKAYGCSVKYGQVAK
jgi:peroxiredoxin